MKPQLRGSNLPNLTEVAEAFWNGRDAVGVPAGFANMLGTDDGFRVQLLMQQCYDRVGDMRVGWKVAATNPAVQQQLGVDEPAFGSLRQSRRYISGNLAVSHLVQPHIECELCFEVSDRIATARTLDDVRASIVKCYPAFEIIEKRVPITDFGGAMADNAEHTAIALGSGVAIPQDLDFSQVECRLSVNGTVAGSAEGSAVLGNPLNSILWLAERLKRYDAELAPGALVMTGSFLRQQPIKAGDKIIADFDGIGAVEVTAVE